MSRLAQRAGILRVPYRERDDLIALVVHWLSGDSLTSTEYDVVERLGCRDRQRGLSALDGLEPRLRHDVAGGIRARAK